MKPEQISLLAKRMAPFADGSNRMGLVNVMYFDSESERLAEDFVSSFRAAGWNLPGRGITGLGPSYRRSYHEGIQVMVHSEKHAPKGLAELKRTLQEFGMTPSSSTDENVRADQFGILIGVRPKN